MSSFIAFNDWRFISYCFGNFLNSLAILFNPSGHKQEGLCFISTPPKEGKETLKKVP